MKAVKGKSRAKNPRLYHYLFGMCCVSLFVSLPSEYVLAQEIEEIVVSARKRAEVLQETPVAVAVLSREDIEKKVLSSIIDAGNFTPNVSFQRGTTDIGGAVNASFFIRGIGQLDYAPTTDPGVGLYVDGVYFGRVQGAILELTDMEQVEILKGPQGTLFGKNALGGAINIATIMPKYEFSGMIGASVGEDDRLDIDGYVNAPITDNLAVRVSVAHRSQDGFINRPLAEDTLGEENTQIIRGKILYEPGERTQFVLTGDFTKVDANANIALTPLAAGGFLVGLWNQLVAEPVPLIPENTVTGDNRVSFSTGDSRTFYEGGGVSLKAEHDFGTTLLRSITAYRAFDSRDERDGDGSPADFGQLDYRNSQEQFSQEINLIGTLLSERVNYTVGAYYFHEDAELKQDVGLGAGIFDALEALPSASVPLGPFVCPAPMTPCAGGAGNPFNVLLDVPRNADLEVDVDSYAVFGEIDINFTSDFSAVAGIRFTEDQKDFFIESARKASGVPVVTPTDVSDSWSEVTPRFGLTYNVTDNLFIYATASKGYKAGGFNARPANAAAAEVTFDPEKIWAYEAGFKSTLFDQRLRFNVTGFYYDYTDVQLIANAVIDRQTVAIIDNAGKAEFAGFELDLTARITPNFTFSGSLAHLDADYVIAATEITGIPKENEFPKAPAWTGTVSAEYIHPADFGDLSFRIDYAYTDENFAGFRNVEALKQEAHSLVNGRVAWISANQRYQIALYGKNIFDVEYIASGFDVTRQTGQVLAIPNQPRELGVRLRARF